MNETAAAPTIKPGGENPPGSLPEPSAASLAAGQSAIEAHFAEGQPKRRGAPIKHGRYAGRVRNKPTTTAGQVPVGKMANGSAPLLLEESEPLPVPIGTEEITPAFNDEVNRKFAAIVVNGMAAWDKASRRKRLIKETQDAEMADFVCSKMAVGAEPREAMEVGMVETARKYGLDLSKTPEGMVIFGFTVWRMESAAQVQQVMAEYFRMRPANKPAEVKP